ncbi:MAG: hypothetical protein HC897_02595 [Thermoanaerobaculia bacterium]|nr:hypothetical protein [Thermoanaerobaculia bacterium]
MRKTWIGFWMVLGALWLAQAALAADPENDRISTDRRRGEEEQIHAREEWFSRQRGLDELYRPAELRAKAIEDVGLALAAQPELAVAGSWQVVGPSPMTMLSWTMGRVAGRVSALAVSPSSEQVLYLGTASGGLWKTVDGGTNWSAAFDAAGTQTIGSVAIDPNNSNVVWVGTGEQANRCSSYFGMGVFRSTDAGATFQTRNGSGASTLDLSYVNAVAVQPGNSNVVLAGGAGFCSGGVLAGSALYRSTDAGASWSSVLTGQANDVIFDPNNPSVVYAAIGSFLDTVNAGVFKSTDGGANWTLLNNGILSGASARRIRLAMAPTNASILYALVGTSSSNARLYRSLDAGASWSQRNASACDGQCSYNLTLAVSPASSDTVLVGAVRLWRSTNGGTTLSALTTSWGSSQKVHQDTHVVRYSTSNGNRFWVGSDGGLWRTDNGSTSFANLNTGLNITQFYDVAVHPTDSGKIFGGAQDNSSSRRTTSSVWDVVTVTGDGFTNVVDPGNPNYVFIESYPSSGSTGYPSIYRSTNGGGVNGFSLLATTGISSAAATFPWKTEIAILPAGGTSYLFTGSNTVFRATRVRAAGRGRRSRATSRARCSRRSAPT